MLGPSSKVRYTFLISDGAGAVAAAPCFFVCSSQALIPSSSVRISGSASLAAFVCISSTAASIRSASFCSSSICPFSFFTLSPRQILTTVGIRIAASRQATISFFKIRIRFFLLLLMLSGINTRTPF